jgi:CHAD domain-containing protein
MAYSLNGGESVPDGTRRIAQEELASAAEGLRRSSDRDEAVHEARKSIKKVRAVLRLVRGELGKMARAENTRLRDVGRELSQLRDAAAMLEVMDSLEKLVGSRLAPKTLEGVRRGLLAGRRDSEAPQLVSRAAAVLEKAAKRAGAWPLQADGFAALKKGLGRSYRGGRTAMGRVEAQPTDENYHEWRKRVKDHWYHVRLIAGVLGKQLTRYEKSLRALSELLGDEHNAVVLRGRILAEPGAYGAKSGLDKFLELLGERQAELRRTSLAAGSRLYRQKPRRYLASIERGWRKTGATAASG